MTQPNDVPADMHNSTNLGLRQAHRFITIHDPKGISTIHKSPDLQYRDRGGYHVTRGYAVDSVPIAIQDDHDLDAYFTSDSNSDASYVHASVRPTVKGGLSFVTMEMAPGVRTKMHRTVTVDLITVVEGEFIMEMDSGERQLLKAGDIVVQRQTMHRWINPSEDKPARLTSVMIDSDKINVAGQVLEAGIIPDQ